LRPALRRCSIEDGGFRSVRNFGARVPSDDWVEISAPHSRQAKLEPSRLRLGRKASRGLQFLFHVQRELYHALG
jgi:hypothetical protein